VSPPSPAPVAVSAAYTSDGDNLLRAILDAPEDDAPRLVYADWLDEHAGPVACDYCGGRDQCPKGDGTFDEHWHCPRCDGKSNGYAERAEFIRVQCRLAQRPWTSKDMIRGHQLFAGSGPKWWNDLPGNWRATVGGDTIETADGFVYKVRRGFVASVALPTAAFVGTPCQRCAGRGLEANGYAYEDPTCRSCNGAGTTPGLAAALFAAHPVTEVRLADRVPSLPARANPDGPRGSYGWWHDASPETPSDIAYSHEDLPGDIWKLLPEDGRTGHRGTSPYWAWYPSNEAADTALSRACVAYGRSLAKLPALAPVT
jgi:uncharacterized protein (TIGR02996 family)